MKWILARFLDCAHGNFGLLMHEGDSEDHYIFTCEDDWRENQSLVSCIPPGTYVLRRVQSPKFGETFEITGVPGRTHVLLHWGNTEEDTEGCVLVGSVLGVRYIAKDEDTGKPGKKLAVLQSKPAFARFMEAMKGVNETPIEVRGLA